MNKKISNKELRENHKVLWLLKKKYGIATTTLNQMSYDIAMVKAIKVWAETKTLLNK